MSIFVPKEEDSLAVDLAKGLVVSTITSIGVLTGFIAVGYVYSKVDQYRRDKKAEKEFKLTDYKG